MALALTALAHADRLPQTPPSQTVVTDDPHVTVTMGLKVAPSNDPGDSVQWWDRRQAGWQRWLTAKQRFPRAKSTAAELYLSALAEGFNKTLPFLPRTRFHFYVADTLNPSLWPVGGGFFIIHAGLLRQVRDERQFAFLMALELAHESLGHNMRPLRAGDIKWEPGRWRDGDFDSWPIEFWASLVGHDPIERGGFTYTLQQESDALELVYRFFRANMWEYDGINRLVVDLLPTIAQIPGSSSLAKMHANLGMAVRLPHNRPDPPVTPIDSVVNRLTYSRAVGEIANGTLQHYPWMLELVPYRDFVVERNINISEVRDQFDEHAEALSGKVASVLHRSRKEALSTELDELDDRNDDLYDRGKIFGAKLARLYLKGTILIAHQRWKEVVENANEGLRLDSSAEPFMWQRALARQELSQFNSCISELIVGWHYYDHRRELLSLQCHFLEGRYSDSARLALEFRRKYPFDIDGAFWSLLAQIRMKRPLDKLIDEVQAFWGDRPMVRALKIFYFGYLGKLTEAQAMADFKAGQPYLTREWGMLEFAQAWLRETFNALPNDERAEKLRELAELQWPLSRLVRYNLPREAVEVR